MVSTWWDTLISCEDNGNLLKSKFPDANPGPALQASLGYQSQACCINSFLYKGSGEGNGNPLHCSCLGSPTHRGGAWRATVQEVTESQARLNDRKRVQHDQAFRVVRLEKSPQKYYKCRFLGQPPEFQFSWCVWGPPNLHFYKHPADLDVNDSVL